MQINNSSQSESMRVRMRGKRCISENAQNTPNAPVYRTPVPTVFLRKKGSVMGSTFFFFGSFLFYYRQTNDLRDLLVYKEEEEGEIGNVGMDVTRLLEGKNNGTHSNSSSQGRAALDGACTFAGGGIGSGCSRGKRATDGVGWRGSGNRGRCHWANGHILAGTIGGYFV